MEDTINYIEKTRIAWDLLTEASNKKEIITNDELGKKLNVPQKAIQMVLEPIKNYCKNNQLPSLTYLIIDEENNFEHYLDSVAKNRISQEYFWIHDFDWKEIENPFQIPKA